MLLGLRQISLNKLYYLLLIMLCTGFTKMTEGEKALNKFTNSFQTEIKRDYGFSAYGSGASFPVKIEFINLSFYVDCVVTIEEARRLVIPICNKMVGALNKSDYLKPYLANNPASLKNISLTFSFKEDLNQKDLPQSVMVFGTKRLVLYNTLTHTTPMLRDLHRETFDEAVKILQDESTENNQQEI